ncbi:NUDIX hydrolase [Pseudooceanicola aestuarii]|uniref:NUDIX hydrolase n=1 Tax=Pseudooceanicola aestuarii TaxID=2697319 RepID=UPI0013D0C996|nr:NUDIX hydrolase [Pseudooceanicola aestuarii]
MPRADVPPPIPAVLGVVVYREAVLLVRRANPPDAGMWGFPGGKVEHGETLTAAALRELHEETGVSAAALDVFTALDAFDSERDRHFILIAVLCRWVAGAPVAGDDALDAAWVPLDRIADLPGGVSRDVARLARQAARAMAEETE